jgi:hypothetical protein
MQQRSAKTLFLPKYRIGEPPDFCGFGTVKGPLRNPCTYERLGSARQIRFAVEFASKKPPKITIRRRGNNIVHSWQAELAKGTCGMTGTTSGAFDAG